MRRPAGVQLPDLCGITNGKRYLYDLLDVKVKEKVRSSAAQSIGGKNELEPSLDHTVAQAQQIVKDKRYAKAVKDGDMKTAQRMVDEAAKAAGYDIKLHHGTAGEPFYVFRQGSEGIHFGTIAQATKRAEVVGSRYGYKHSNHTSADIRYPPLGEFARGRRLAAPVCFIKKER